MLEQWAMVNLFLQAIGAYAIDYDGDGNADLFNSVDDAIGSVANYLYIHGWKREGDIVYESFPNNVRKVFNPS